MKLVSGRDYPNTYRGFVAIAVEIRQPKGFGRVRMHHIPDASGEKTKDQYYPTTYNPTWRSLRSGLTDALPKAGALFSEDLSNRRLLRVQLLQTDVIYGYDWGCN